MVDTETHEPRKRCRYAASRLGRTPCTEDWRYLSSHLNDERLHDLRILLGECPRGFGAKLVAEIRTLLPGSQPGHALVLALARLTYDADLDC